MKNKYGQWALVTGASSGIGEHFARKFAEKEIDLILIARREEKLIKIAEELKANHKVEIVVIKADLSEENFLKKIIDEVGEKEIGILVNNAGLGSVGEFDKVDPADEIKMVKLNCLAPVILTHYFTKQMIERKRGAIIFLGSLLSFQPTPYSATYSATKSFNTFLGDALWYELKKHNIDVLSLNPGGTDTEFLRLSSQYKNSKYIRSPKDVVETALNALGKKPSVVDGFINKIAVTFGKLLPRKLLVNISGIISGKLHELREQNERES